MAIDPARAKTLFLHASDLADPADRAAYLDLECGDNTELRARVEALLAADGLASSFAQHDATGVFDPSPAETLAPTQKAASGTMPGTWDSNPKTGLATDGATGGGTPAHAPPAARPVGFTPGQVIAGRYTLLEVLGEGGMGTVYKAEQSQPVRRQVALKLIKLGMDSRTVLARFDAERQALAMMDHPNIARVYDGGATEAHQPFFVMELVQGIPITDYCDRHRLTVDARLHLFVAVCQAVQHAHQKGIIHRDLKPSNVMVTEVDGRPTPKVIDFGVAKATEFDLTDQTLGDTGAIVGTPTYMSPEQADPSSMDIDTRTDVYALGVILYELLAGSPPLDATQFKRGALLEMLRMVREVEPSKPSTKVGTADALPSIAANRGIDPERLKRELRGDLDWIVMKALEKDRTRRYETANGFGADILRHLASEPVLAAPPSRSYRLRKFARKHRVGVIAASLVVLALVAGIAGTTLGLLEARHQEGLANDRAEGERLAKQEALAAAEEEKKAKETVEDVLGFVEKKVFAAARPKNVNGGLGFDVKLADAITAALPAIDKGFSTKPLTEARLRQTIGVSFRTLGKWDLAAEQLEAAWSLNRRHLGPDHSATLVSMSYLAGCYAELGRTAEALKLQEELLALQKAKFGPDHPQTLRGMNDVAATYANLGRTAEALKVFEQTLAIQKVKLGTDHPETLWSMHSVANAYYDLGRWAEAIKLSEETLAVRKVKLGHDDPQTLMTMNNLAHYYSGVGRYAEALKLHEETLPLRKDKLGSDHPDTLMSMYSLAVSYFFVGRYGEALKLFEETLSLRKAKLGTDHPETLNSMHAVVQCYSRLGRYGEALKLGEETLAVRKVKLGPDHPKTLDSRNALTVIYHSLGRSADALKLAEETQSLMKAKFGPDHPNTLNGMNDVAALYYSLGRSADALKLFEETQALMKAKFGPDHPYTLLSLSNVALGYLAVGRRDEALSLLEKASFKDSLNFFALAAFQVWFGEDDAYAATRKRFLVSARDTKDGETARRATLACALRPSTDRAEREALLVLARKAQELGKGQWERLALGMAEFRDGQFTTAEETLSSVAKDGQDANAAGTAAFYRAMILSQQGKNDEAREIATRAAAEMIPLPRDEQKPTAPGGPDILVLWLAYKDAKAMIGFDTPPAAPPSAKPDGK